MGDGVNFFIEPISWSLVYIFFLVFYSLEALARTKEEGGFHTTVIVVPSLAQYAGLPEPVVLSL